jgi:hypothetical protein
VNLCKHCGVEVESDADYCPLCRRPLRGEGEKVEEVSLQPAVVPREANQLISRWLLEIISILALAGAIVVAAADFAFGRSLTWARYVLASIAFLWLSGVFLIVFLRRWFVYLLAETAALSLFLWLLDRLTPGPAWFPPLALPVTLLAGVMLVLTLATGRKRERSPLMAVAIAMLAAGLFLVGLELILNGYLYNRFFVSWSVVALACVLPSVLLLLHLRRWFRKRESEIRRLFHL